MPHTTSETAMSNTKLFWWTKGGLGFVIGDGKEFSDFWVYAGTFSVTDTRGVYVSIDMVNDKDIPNIALHYETEEEMIEDLLGLTDTGECVRL